MDPCPQCGRPLESGAACASCAPSASKPGPEALTGRQIFVGVLIALPVLYWWFNAQLNPSVALPTETRSVAQADADPETRTGVYRGHEFVSMRRGDDVTATFSPYLPPDDDIVTNAVREVVQMSYGVSIATVRPRLVERVIVFESGQRAFLVTLVKQDTGRIHSVAIRRRPV